MDIIDEKTKKYILGSILSTSAYRKITSMYRQRTFTQINWFNTVNILEQSSKFVEINFLQIFFWWKDQRGIVTVTHTRVGKVKVNFASLKKILVPVSRLLKFKKNFNSDYIEVAKKISYYYLIMELTFMQETTASGFLITTFDIFDNRNSITQTGTAHASSGKLFNRHLKLTSYFFKKVSNVKYIILNGFAKNSRVKKI